MKQSWILAIAVGLGGWAAAEQVTVDGVAAYVNDSVITVGDVREAMAPMASQLKDAYQGAELAGKLREVYDETLNAIIENKLIVTAFESDEKLNKEAVEKLVERRVSDFIQDRFKGDRQEFLKALTDEHLSLEQWRARLREDLIVGIMRNREVESKVIVSPRDVRRIYESKTATYTRPERLNLAVILIRGSTNGAETAARLLRARETVKKLKAGEDFAECAKHVSEDAKADKGGEWGWMDTADLRRELAEAVKAVPPGGVSDVVQAGDDYYILKVRERQKAGLTPFDEVRPSIEKDVRRKEAKRLYGVWVERLKKDAYIDIIKNAKA